MTALSILDLVRVTEATDARGALDNARDLAAHAEGWSYTCFWVAEHHNMAGVASAATALVVGAENTIATAHGPTAWEVRPRASCARQMLGDALDRAVLARAVAPFEHEHDPLARLPGFGLHLHERQLKAGKKIEFVRTGMGHRRSTRLAG